MLRVWVQDGTLIGPTDWLWPRVAERKILMVCCLCQAFAPCSPGSSRLQEWKASLPNLWQVGLQPVSITWEPVSPAEPQSLPQTCWM